MTGATDLVARRQRPEGASREGASPPCFFERKPSYFLHNARPAIVSRVARRRMIRRNVSAPMDDVSSPRREPILNVPPVMVALLAVLGLVHAVRGFLLSDESELDFLLLFAFIPARYDATLIALPGGLAAEVVDLRDLCADPWRSDASRPQCGLAARFRHAAGAPVRAAAVSRLLRRHRDRGRARASVHPCRSIAADGRRLGDDFRRHGGSDAICLSAAAGRCAGARPTTRLSDPGAAAVGGVARPARAGFSRRSGSGSICCSASGRCRSPASEQQVAWQAHVGGFVAGLVLFGWFDPSQREQVPTQPQ